MRVSLGALFSTGRPRALDTMGQPLVRYSTASPVVRETGRGYWFKRSNLMGLVRPRSMRMTIEPDRFKPCAQSRGRHLVSTLTLEGA